MNINVLIFPCEGNSNELHDALSYCFNITVFGASSVSRHGKFIYKNYYPKLPYITEEKFFEKKRADILVIATQATDSP